MKKNQIPDFRDMLQIEIQAQKPMHELGSGTESEVISPIPLNHLGCIQNPTATQEISALNFAYFGL